MTTATRTDDPAADEAFSERELQKQRETLRELRDETIPQLEAQAAEIEHHIADAIEAGDDPDDLRAELASVREDLDLYRGAAPELARRIRARWRRRLRADAADRLRSVKKTAGGIAGEVPRRIEEARELADRLVDRLSWLATRPELLRRLGVEADLLADEFDLDRPEIKSVADLDENPERVARDLIQTVKRETRRVRAVPGTSDRRKVVNLPAAFDVETPTPGLLDRWTKLTDEASDD